MNAKSSLQISNLNDLATRLAEIALRIKIKLSRTFRIEKSDMQAQILVYGAFVSRVIDQDRAELDILPAGELEEIYTLVRPELNEIQDTLNSINSMKDLFQSRDQIVGFYEGFLKYYNPDIRIKKGVFFTPDPVVDFIARSVNVLLKREIGLSNGFLDPSVKILDPATGTGTFVLHVMNLVSKEWNAADCKSECIQIPELIGVEIMKVPLMISRLAITLALEERRHDCWQDRPPRMVLGNALDLSEDVTKGVSIIIGNPPYSRSSQNKATSVEPLLASYKNDVKVDKNIQALSDDYVKFFRFAQAIIDKSGWGIVGFVSNHTFLRGNMFRGMRRSLLTSFDKMFVLDLHGNSKIQEDIPANVVDQSLFPIQQGTCIVFLVKYREQGPKQKVVMIHDLFGTRDSKFAWLAAHDVSNIPWTSCTGLLNPACTFVSTLVDAKAKSEYDSFKALDEIFPFNSVGGKPGDDELFVAFDPQTALTKFTSFLGHARGDNDIGTLTEAKRKILAQLDSFDAVRSKVISYSYRPFDTRWAYFDARAWTRSVSRIKKQCDGKNLVLLSTKLVKDLAFNHVFVSRKYTDVIFLSSTSSTNCYLYPVLFHGTDGTKWNLSTAYIDYLNGMGTPASQDDLTGTLGYIYAILWSSRFKHHFNTFLKQGAPRILLVQEKSLFENLRTLGKELIDLHLLENIEPGFSNEQKLHGSGNNMVKKFRYTNNKIYFNDDQYFAGISQPMLSFAIGKYAVLKKWMKDRIGTVLANMDIEKYCMIAHAIEQTLTIIDAIDAELQDCWMS